MRHHHNGAGPSSAALALLAFLAPAVAAQGTGFTPIERTALVVTPAGVDYQTDLQFLPGSGSGGNLTMSAGGSGLVWSIDSDGSWIADAISIGNSGTEAIVEYGDFDNHVEAHSAHSAETLNPLIQHASSTLNANRTVVSSAVASAHVSAHFEFNSVTHHWVPTLRKFSLGSTAPDWTFVSDLGQFSTDTLHTDISADGSRVVLLEFDMGTVSTRISVFDATSSTPLLQFAVMTFSGVRDFDLSSDGSTLVLVSNQRLAICDVATGTVNHIEFLTSTPNYRAVALSGDGALVTYSGLGELRVMSREVSSAYTTVHQQSMTPTAYARRVAVSDDGSTVAAGIHMLQDKNGVRVLALQASNFEPLLDLALSGSGTLTNLVEVLECSQDGEHLAVGMWGDEDGMLPEVLVFRTDNGELLLSENLDGSVKAMSLAPDGRHLAVASKGIHEMVWGGGGSLRLYRVGQPDIELGGAPTAGNLTQLTQNLRAGQTGRILVATQLAAVPSDAPQYGSGLLYLDPATLIELPLLTADASNSTVQPFQLGAAGAELFFQAVNVDRGALSSGWLKVTVAP